MKRLTGGRFVAVLLALTALLLAALLAGIGVGPSGAAPSRVIDALLHPDHGGALSDIVWQIRLPRLLLASLVGASLSVSGVIFQALLRNPLADPFILGVSGGAALGGIAMLALGFKEQFGLSPADYRAARAAEGGRAPISTRP